MIDTTAHRPRTATWELTLRCQMSCKHCGSRAGAARGHEMPRETALTVARDLGAAGCEKLSLSGGEPTLAPHWPDVVAAATAAGVRVNMIVNAAAHDRDFVRRARDSGLVNLGVSLDGLAATHDELRGRPGHFARVLRLLDDCAAVGLSVGAITTIWRGNQAELEAIHDLLVGRVFVWQVQLGVAMGNLGRDRQLAPEQLLDVVPRLAALVARKQLRVTVADSVGYYGAYETALRGGRCWQGCNGGLRHVGIEADGGVKACLSMQATGATEGNLQREPFADIWARPGAFATCRAPRLESLGGFCRTCEHAALCRGGCQGMRVAEGGENPFCYHRVATLARQRKPRSSSWAMPAAFFAALAAGCSGDGCSQDLYGVPEPDAAVMQDAYGIPMDAGPDAPWAVDAYGIMTDADTTDAAPADAGPDGGDLYGIPTPDAG